MERIYYRILLILKMLIYLIYRLKSIIKPRRFVTETDYKKLNIMFKYYEKEYLYCTNFSFLNFKPEIRRTKVKKDCEIPDNIVKMGSIVSFKNEQTNNNLTKQLVYPNQEQINTFKLSVFSAVGMVLFGQKSGTRVSCFQGKRKIELKILSIV